MYLQTCVRPVSPSPSLETLPSELGNNLSSPCDKFGNDPMSYGKVGSMIVDKLKDLLGRKETFANMNAVKIQKVARGFTMRKGMLPDAYAMSII